MATQQVVTSIEQAVHRWLAQGTRARLTLEAAWPSREEPVDRVQLEGDRNPSNTTVGTASWTR